MLKRGSNKSICFFSLNSKLVFERDMRHSGGAEIQQFQIANYLLKLGWNVSFITAKINNCIDTDIKLYQTIDVDNLSNVNRFKRIAKYLLLLLKLMKIFFTLDADIVYQRGYTELTVLNYFFGKLFRKKIVFAGASNKDFIQSKQYRGRFLNKLMGILRRVDYVIVQHSDQAELASNNGIERVELIANISPSIYFAEIHETDSKYISWIGSLRKLKRPEILLNLAKKLPMYQFQMIGPDDMKDLEYSRQIRYEASKIENIHIYGYQSAELLNKHLDESICLISTSLTEGFPNTFLQAWARGKPVISYTFDFTTILSDQVDTSKFGIVSDEIEKIEMYIKSLVGMNPDLDLRNYVKNHYSQEIIGAKYDTLFSNLAQR